MPQLGRRERKVISIRDVTDEVEQAMKEGLEDYIVETWNETLDQTVDNMFNGRNAMGKPFKPLEDETGVPLVDTGTLAGSIADDSYLMRQVPAGVFTSEVKYAEWHEFGAPDANIPKRPFLVPALRYADDISPEIFRRTVDKKVDAALMD